MQVSVEIPVEAEAAAIAREVVAGALAEVPIPEDRIEDLRLLTSEIVTNAVRHAGLAREDTIGVAVEVSERRVRVEVADDGPGFDPSDLPESSPRGSRGLGPAPRDAVVGPLGRDQERAEPRVVRGESVIRLAASRCFAGAHRDWLCLASAANAVSSCPSVAVSSEHEG